MYSIYVSCLFITVVKRNHCSERKKTTFCTTNRRINYFEIRYQTYVCISGCSSPSCVIYLRGILHGMNSQCVFQTSLS